MISCVEEKENYYFRMAPQNKLIPRDDLKRYLESIYIRKKSEQNRIIRFYEIGVKENKRESYLVQALEGMGYAEDTIYEITRYIVCWNARVSINKEMENQK